MKRHKENIITQTNLLWTYLNLAQNDDDLKKDIGKLAIKSILHSIRSHKYAPDISKVTMILLNQLAKKKIIIELAWPIMAVFRI